SGTHALTLALFGILRANDKMLAISGAPYDTLLSVISGDNIGSLKDFGVSYEQIALKNNDFDLENIEKSIKAKTPKLIFIGRSRGYEWRDALSISQIENAIKFIRKIDKNIVIMVDNCYGEFMDTLEPTDVDADIMVGSLIKNAGGGLAPTGGYIAGKEKYIEQVAYRLTSPSIGMEIGSYAYGYQPFYQGLFLAPHTTINATKGSALIGQVFSDLGYDVCPKPTAKCNDTVRSIKFNTKEELISFIQSIQKASPIDSNVLPMPWAMPGYDEEVIMAAGTFVAGASIELSADSPIKEPYIAYVQGGLTYEHIKLATILCTQELLINKN
ncbi:MAG: methionine gamma-lyase family protein, partial [Clostridia bacterium]|nr:methionine gamma-lyase family protein [Clostridia bacterium]